MRRQNVPDISISGHTLGTTELNDPKIKKLLSTRKSCPIHRGLPTDINEKGYVRSCKRFRTLAKKKRKKSSSNFSVKITEPCAKCEIGERIEKGEPFKPHKNVKFIKEPGENNGK